MDAGGPSGLGEVPDDHDSGDDSPLRGWIDPDDRLWRHPSEADTAGRSSATAAASSAPAGSSPPARVSHRMPWTTAAMGATAVGVAVIAGALLFRGGDAPTSGSATAIETGSTVVTPGGVSGLDAHLRASLVELRGMAAGTHVTETGIALDGDLVVTSAAGPVAKASAVEADTSDGRRIPARLAGADTGSGIAVFVIATALPSATFGSFDADRLRPGTAELAACLCSTHPGADLSAAATVRHSGDTLAVPGALLVDTIETHSTLDPAPLGGALFDRHDDVLGVLVEEVPDGNDHTDVFVPGALAEGVARQLAGSHAIRHGWLGVRGSDEPGGSCGVVVASVVGGSPAASAGLTPGAVIVGIDGDEICTIGELEAHLYLDPPGREVAIALGGAAASSSPLEATLAAGLG